MTRQGPKRVAVRPADSAGWLTDLPGVAGVATASIEDADALLWASAEPDGLASILEAHPGLTWVHLPVAGIERFVPVIDDRRTWTCAKGANAEVVAEHALALMLGLARRLPEFARQREWMSQVGRSLLAATVVVVGAGAVARALAELLTPFGTTCVLVGTTPHAGLHYTWRPVADLDELLPGADFVVVAAASTESTARIIGARRLRLMSPSAYLVNVARGSLVDDVALRDALESGMIAGAGLDVTSPEPLAPDDGLFELRNCLVSCHSAGLGADTAGLLRDRAVDNLRRYAAGRPLVGLIDPRKGY